MQKCIQPTELWSCIWLILIIFRIYLLVVVSFCTLHWAVRRKNTKTRSQTHNVNGTTHKNQKRQNDELIQSIVCFVESWESMSVFTVNGINHIATFDHITVVYAHLNSWMRDFISNFTLVDAIRSTPTSKLIPFF